jgi:two-component system LytT family response regulator
MSEPLKVIVADDEPLARDLIRHYVQQQPGVTIVAECADGDQVARAIDGLEADVAFLDIRMPGTDIFAVLDRAAAAGRRLPAVIFSTAYDEYAVRAFDLDAVDYLVKPYTAERLSAALRRARTRQTADREASLSRAIRDLGPRPDRLLVPDGRRMVPIALADIVWIKAEDDYARVHAGGRSYLVGRTLKELEHRLDPERFVRIHRSAIVQTSHIREVIAEDGSRFRLCLSDGTHVIVSRARAVELRRLML